VKATFPTDRGDVIVRLCRVDCIDVHLHHRADPYTSTIVRPPGEATFCSPLKSLPQSTSRMSTQSSSPPSLDPGFVKSRVPVFPNGEPAMFLNVPTTGSNQRELTGPLS